MVRMKSVSIVAFTHGRPIKVGKDDNSIRI